MFSCEFCEISKNTLWLLLYSSSVFINYAHPTHWSVAAVVVVVAVYFILYDFQ